MDELKIACEMFYFPEYGITVYFKFNKSSKTGRILFDIMTQHIVENEASYYMLALASLVIGKVRHMETKTTVLEDASFFVSSYYEVPEQMEREEVVELFKTKISLILTTFRKRVAELN